MTDNVILVHTVFVVGDDDIRLDLADDVADGKANLVIVRQQAVFVIQDVGFAPQLFGKGLCLRDFSPAVFGNIRPGGSALFPGGQRQSHGLAAVNGAGRQQRPGGQLGIPNVGADGKYSLCLHSPTAPSA